MDIQMKGEFNPMEANFMESLNLTIDGNDSYHCSGWLSQG
jgi:hypothetical protein